jgi:hypothetical protein
MHLVARVSYTTDGSVIVMGVVGAESVFRIVFFDCLLTVKRSITRHVNSVLCVKGSDGSCVVRVESLVKFSTELSNLLICFRIDCLSLLSYGWRSKPDCQPCRQLLSASSSISYQKPPVVGLRSRFAFDPSKHRPHEQQSMSNSLWLVWDPRFGLE